MHPYGRKEHEYETHSIGLSTRPHRKRATKEQLGKRSEKEMWTASFRYCSWTKMKAQHKKTEPDENNSNTFLCGICCAMGDKA